MSERIETLQLMREGNKKLLGNSKVNELISVPLTRGEIMALAALCSERSGEMAEEASVMKADTKEDKKARSMLAFKGTMYCSAGAALICSLDDKDGDQ